MQTHTHPNTNRVGVDQLTDSQDIPAYVNFYICIESMGKIGENVLMLKVLKIGP